MTMDAASKEAFAPTTKASPHLANVRRPDPCTVVLFGGTGDLAARKIFPALFGLWHSGWLPERWQVVGIGRRTFSDDDFRGQVGRSLAEFRKGDPADAVAAFLRHVHYQASDLGAAGDYARLATRLAALEREGGIQPNRLFYLAVDPQFFRPAVEGLAHAGLTRAPEPCWARVVIEKPFGTDLTSSRELDAFIGKYLAGDQVYRIDHYLGKDTVQNLLAFRFGNALFEPLFRREHVDHIQITAAETVGMEGKRGAFYDHAGALRDVVQNHLLQLLALIAMEPPATLKARDVKDAKLNVLRNLTPLEGAVSKRVVRAQYTAGTVGGKPVRGYLEEEGVAPNSKTETYVALRAEVDSWRWAGVPFLLRTGKRMGHRVTEVAVNFKLPPLRLFRTLECDGDICNLAEAVPNVLCFRIQPEEGITLDFSAKRPGMSLDLHRTRLSFDYRQSFNVPLPEAYERLIFDAARGDSTLFMRSDELDAAWEFVTPILDSWAGESRSLLTYQAGSWGPTEANRLAEGCQGGWRQP